MLRFSTNEIFSKDLISNTSTLLNIPECIVSSVLSSVVLHIVKDAADQRFGDRIVVRIPRIADITLKMSTKNLTVVSINLVPKFRKELRSAVMNGSCVTMEDLESNLDDLLLDKFLNLVERVQDESASGGGVDE